MDDQGMLSFLPSLARDQDRKRMSLSTRELFEALEERIPMITRGATINIINCIRGVSIGSVLLIANYLVPLGGLMSSIDYAILSLGVLNGVVASVQILLAEIR